MEIELPIRTAVVCHDAGAANVVIAALLETGRKDWRAYMQGPAKKIWESAFPEVVLYDCIEQAIEGSELLISGTGWASDIEHESRCIAKSKTLKSIAVIDHWVNYAERFVRYGEQVLPDEIWVTDEYALEIASELFIGKTILQIPNYYLERQLKEIEFKGRIENPELLYILEPILYDWGMGKPGEFQALDYFVLMLPMLDLPANVLIRLRPHPSEQEGKYENWIKAHSELNVKIDDSINISHSISRAEWVVGCHSYALIIALMAGRKVFSSLPPWAPSSKLPHKGIMDLANLKAM